MLHTSGLIDSGVSAIAHLAHSHYKDSRTATKPRQGTAVLVRARVVLRAPAIRLPFLRDGREESGLLRSLLLFLLPPPSAYQSTAHTTDRLVVQSFATPRSGNYWG